MSAGYGGLATWLGLTPDDVMVASGAGFGAFSVLEIVARVRDRRKMERFELETFGPPERDGVPLQGGHHERPPTKGEQP